MIRRSSALVLLALVAVLNCAAPPPRDAGPASAPASAPAPSRTMQMVVNTEVGNLSSKAVGPVNPQRTTRLFNASMTLVDGQENVRPYIAESMPQLNTESWRVLTDGRMENTWKLRPGLTWHDGTPLTADDFVFAHQVYTAPGLAVFEPKPTNLIEQITAVDPQTLRISWRSTYLDNGVGHDPLPRSRLGEALAAYEEDPAGQRDAFLAHRFWTMDYVGAGPYRLTNWEPASHMEGAAFDGHALGKPRIDRFVLRFINDGNTVLSTVLAGQTHYVMTGTMGFENAMVLRRQGGFNDTEGQGKIHPIGSAVIAAATQHRPEYQQTAALLDVRVRKAVVHAIDRESINDGLYEGQAPVANTFFVPESPYYPEIDRALTKYPYDPRRTEQFMVEAGFAKDRDGFFASANGERLQPLFWTPAAAQREQLLAILVNTWQRAGLDVQAFIMPNTLARDQQANTTFPGMLAYGTGLMEATAAQSLASEQIGTAANRWNGSNRGGWSNPEYDSLWDRYNKTLDRPEQIQTIVQMMKLQSEQLPNFPLYYFINPVAHVSALKGPETGAIGTTPHWNIHLWELPVL